MGSTRRECKGEGHVLHCKGSYLHIFRRVIDSPGKPHHPLLACAQASSKECAQNNSPFSMAALISGTAEPPAPGSVKCLP
jgi:hypothetical protein